VAELEPDMSEDRGADLETDPRFPSGKWTGFFLQQQVPGRHAMELHLTFRRGQILGEGRDWVGKFLISGRYELADGKCHWTKRYLGKHDVFYGGFNEGKGIWGMWELPAAQNAGQLWRGGFHIWPEGMPNPSDSTLEEEADLPIHVEEAMELEPVGAGGSPHDSLRSRNC
jgi:hypothetical protein